MADEFGKNTSAFGDFTLGRESFDLGVESLDWNFDIGSGFHCVEQNSKNLRFRDGDFLTPTIALFFKAFQFVDEQVESNDA